MWTVALHIKHLADVSLEYGYVVMLYSPANCSDVLHGQGIDATGYGGVIRALLEVHLFTFKCVFMKSELICVKGKYHYGPRG